MIRAAIATGLATLIFPQFLISEPSEPIALTSSTPTLEVLFSDVMGIQSDSSLLLRLNHPTDSNIVALCPNTSSIVTETPEYSIVQWNLTRDCPLPLVTYRGAGYILPVGSLPTLDVLTDVSTETLKNTLAASSMVKNDFRISGVRYQEFFHNIEKVLSARAKKFLLPIPDVPVPTHASYLPGSSRPFRADNTDGVHHGWDFYTADNTPVRAVEDGVIIHVKRDFDWSEMDHLFLGHTELEKQKNLDTYRGNTVYIKTLSGHVAIYAHLRDIPKNISIWTRVTAGEVVGHVGDSAVPGKAYLYHLHFEIGINPFIDEKAGTYSYDDILLWPFWWQGKSATWVRDKDDSLFQ